MRQYTHSWHIAPPSKACTTANFGFPLVLPSTTHVVCSTTCRQAQKEPHTDRPMTSSGTAHAPPAQASCVPAPLPPGPQPNLSYPYPPGTLPMRGAPGSQSAGALRDHPERHPPPSWLADCCLPIPVCSTPLTCHPPAGGCYPPGGIAKVRAVHKAASRVLVN